MRNDSSRNTSLQRTRKTAEWQKPIFLFDMIKTVGTATVELTQRNFFSLTSKTIKQKNQ